MHSECSGDVVEVDVEGSEEEVQGMIQLLKRLDVVLRGPAGQRVLAKCAHSWLYGKDQEDGGSFNWVEGWGVLHIWIRV